MAEAGKRRRVLIMGAAGRDFHNFNMVYRGDAASEVVAFTAAQIPGIAGRRYPAALSGPLYPDGIAIHDEAELERLCRELAVAEVVFAYSDVRHEQVMHAGSRALACGADFRLLGPDSTMLRASRPVIAISAVRTGCGKSQIGRWLSRHLAGLGVRPAVLRHPMPYGDLARQRLQRFATAGDLAAADCSIEEREEYEPHIAAGGVIYAGVDYGAILAAAETEAEVIVWEGGNNDFPFVRPDLHFVLVDALRPDQLVSHHPGEAVLRMADVLVIAKADAAAPGVVEALAATLGDLCPGIPVVRAASPVSLDDPAAVAGRCVLVVEDGPTVTHGGLAHGAGLAAVEALGDVTLVDPRRSAVPEILAVYEKYPHIGPVLPAVGYGEAQRRALARSIEDSAAEVVVSATPVDLAALLELKKPVVRARYAHADMGEPTLAGFVNTLLTARGLAGSA